jgi:hypothetical protein
LDFRLVLIGQNSRPARYRRCSRSSCRMYDVRSLGKRYSPGANRSGFRAALRSPRRALSDGRFLADLAHSAMKLRQVLRNQITLGIAPGPSPDSVPRVHGGRGVGRLRAQISAPRMVARALGLCQSLAVRIGSRETPEVSAFAKSLAGDEKNASLTYCLPSGSMRAPRFEPRQVHCLRRSAFHSFDHMRTKPTQRSAHGLAEAP